MDQAQDSTPSSSDDADNLFDWLSASNEVYYDLEREVVLFGSRSIGS